MLLQDIVEGILGLTKKNKMKVSSATNASCYDFLFLLNFQMKELRLSNLIFKKIKKTMYL